MCGLLFYYIVRNEHRNRIWSLSECKVWHTLAFLCTPPHSLNNLHLLALFPCNLPPYWIPIDSSGIRISILWNRLFSIIINSNYCPRSGNGPPSLMGHFAFFYCYNVHIYFQGDVLQGYLQGRHISIEKLMPRDAMASSKNMSNHQNWP